MRWRLLYLIGVLVVVAMGLASRRFGAMLPVVVARYAGDILWAVVVFGIIGVLAPAWSTARVAVSTLVVSYGVEVSQLYPAPWLDAIRDTRIGGMVLGQGFLWSDIVCYTVGVALSAALEVVSRARRT